MRAVGAATRTLPYRRDAPQRPLGLARLETAALVLMLIAAATPAGAVTARQLANPDSMGGLWQQRLGPANPFELGLVIIVAAWVAVRTPGWWRTIRVSALDGGVMAVAAITAGLQLIAAARGLPEPRYMAIDAERLFLALGAYLVVSRATPSPRSVRFAALGLGGVLAARAVELVLRGAIGGTDFGTATGRSALLITEDSLLVGVPAVLAAGALVERRLRGWAAVAAAVGILAALAVDALSLRRGALLLILLALAIRVGPGLLQLGPRRLLASVAVVAAAGGALWAAGPLRPVADQVAYTVRSAVGLEEDASTGQRSRELRDLRAIMRPGDWLAGRGIGTPWNSSDPATNELAAFGGGETSAVRIGWHLYGADFVYKLGALGLAVWFTVLLLALRRGWSAARALGPADAWIVRSLIVILPLLALFMFTNPRIALITGVLAAVLSRFIDLARARSTPGWPRPSALGGVAALPPAPAD